MKEFNGKFIEAKDLFTMMIRDNIIDEIEALDDKNVLVTFKNYPGKVKIATNNYYDVLEKVNGINEEIESCFC